MPKPLKTIKQFFTHFPARRLVRWVSIAFLTMAFWFCLPSPLFTSPASFVIEDEQHHLLGATIASDGQWRFPYTENVPEKFRQCIIAFEDKRFYYHPGVDPMALGRAIFQNIRDKKVVSGASTITMQVIRLSRIKNRSMFQKILEAIQAVRLECGYSKNEILAHYASNAPFGSNVVGLDAASWRYFGRAPQQLSWAEMATLAVLPNAPALVHPGKNRAILLAKRNGLINKLAKLRQIDQQTAELAKLEPLPGNPLPLPMLAPHLLNRFKKEFTANKENKPAAILTSTLQINLQQSITQLIDRYQANYKGNGINNAAAMVLEIETGNVLAYVGNVYQPGNADIESYVDVLASPRSPGSTLKPLLYAAAQSDGLLLPGQLMPDIPTRIGGYAPQNFNLEYDGAVPAKNALSRSLNIPAIKMLQQYKYPRFYNVLQQCGFTTIRQPADYYGLSLILGGCEVTPWELAGVYSSFARSYLHQQKNKGKMAGDDWHMPIYKVKGKREKEKGEESMANGQRLEVNAQEIGRKSNKVIATNGIEENLLNDIFKKGFWPSKNAGVANMFQPTATQTAVTPSTAGNAPPTAFDFTAIWHTLNAMQEVMRPGEEGLWNLFGSAQRIAWKTGTSFGFRDGWAIGLTPKYCVVVWVGNTDGEGRPELTGINTAAPVMFDIFRMLPTSAWFDPPVSDYTYLPVCHESGYKAGASCNRVDTMLVSVNGKKAPQCPYHTMVHLNSTGTFRVTADCISPFEMKNENWFVLPPAMEYYYKQRHPEYKVLPAFMPGCSTGASRQMELIYPAEQSKIFIPTELTGQPGKVIFTAAHHNPDARIFWHLDNEYTGTTSRFHQMAMHPTAGKHILTITDERGETISRPFEVQEKEKH